MIPRLKGRGNEIVNLMPLPNGALEIVKQIFSLADSYRDGSKSFENTKIINSNNEFKNFICFYAEYSTK